MSRKKRKIAKDRQELDEVVEIRRRSRLFFQGAGRVGRVLPDARHQPPRYRIRWDDELEG